MALTISSKLQRMIRLLHGLRNRRVLGVLKSRGFTQRDLDEGWRLLRAAIDVKVDQVDLPKSIEPGLLDRINAWEDRWYQTARATLERHFPEVEARLFANLPRTSGVELLATVPVFLRRIGEMEQGAWGDAGRRARELLKVRGITAEVIGEAAQMLHEGGVPEDAPEPELIDPATQQAAEDAAWAWCKEWSQILRVEIKDGRLLRELGLGPVVTRTVTEEIEDDLGEEIAVPPAPGAATQTATPPAPPRPTDGGRARADLKGGSPFTD